MKSRKNDQLPPRPTLPDTDLKHVYLKGSGPGGQKINKTSSAVQLTHLPTGLVVKSQATRSRTQNHNIAKRILAEKIEVMEKGQESRAAKVIERKQKKKASSMKKKRRKYRRLEEEEAAAGQKEKGERNDEEGEVGEEEEEEEEEDVDDHNDNDSNKYGEESDRRGMGKYVSADTEQSVGCLSPVQSQGATTTTTTTTDVPEESCPTVGKKRC